MMYEVCLENYRTFRISQAVGEIRFCCITTVVIKVSSDENITREACT